MLWRDIDDNTAKHLYLVKRKNKVGYDEIQSFITCETSWEKAKQVNPVYHLVNELWKGNSYLEDMEKLTSSYWTNNPDEIEVLGIGIADQSFGVPKEIYCMDMLEG